MLREITATAADDDLAPSCAGEVERKGRTTKNLIPLLGRLTGKHRDRLMVDLQDSTISECVGMEVDGHLSPCFIGPRSGICGGGHRTISVNGQRIYLHRAAFVLHYGREPAGGIVRHKCNHAACFNPLHLREGTQKDNMADRKALLEYAAQMPCIASEADEADDREALSEALQLAWLLNEGGRIEELAPLFDFECST
ncbi:HNH endonuclease signature motif containing protein [Belnapia rosea]|uniref:HNH endonuclease signature motif containing protein n=1 Tax=Belnapia rosea TaxID=938405 RepID=UPI000887745B|nr:HNH endonuclease signature motif containing protein [Belnapia rosea]SDB15213.1 HNH endonuclease [Belnapia rosea]